MFKKILLASSATEASDHAARVAFNIAAQFGASLELFHVLGVPTRGFSREVVDVKTHEKVEADDEYRAWVAEEIKTHYAEQLARFPSATISLAAGMPYREILREARRTQPDLLVLGGPTGGPEESVYKKTMAGNTLLHVAKNAACPVLVVARPAASFWGGFSSIVVGTDFSSASAAAFDYGLGLAKELGGALHVFHALDVAGALGAPVMDQDSIDGKIRESRNRMRSLYGAGLRGLPESSMEVWEGIPHIEIVKFAREKQADLIIMAHHASRADAGRMGSCMEQVVMRAGCPVISVHRKRDKQEGA